MEYTAYAAQVRPEVDAALESALAELSCPDALRDAMRYALLGPGKRVRPLLTLLACEACGGERSSALPAACAVEMMHAASLVHDDLPALDNDDMRRGRPSVHAAYGEAEGILAGDALFLLPFSVLARLHDAKHVRQCVALLAHAAGPEGMAGGQWDDMSPKLDASLVSLQSLHGRKTGALITASLLMGGVIADASSEQVTAFRAYGSRIGLAFQIKDDLLDRQGHVEETGKRTEKDVAHGKLTFPGLLGIEESEARLRALSNEAIDCLEPLADRAATLADLARVLCARTA